jgi:hypothetical protein
VNTQFKQFKGVYMKYQFFPFLIYFAIIISYNTVTNPHTYSLRRYLLYQIEDYTFYDNLHIMLGYAMVAFALYFVILCYLQLKHSRAKKNLIYLLFHIFVIFSYFIDINNTSIFDPNHDMDFAIPTASLLIVLAYFMLILQL